MTHQRLAWNLALDETSKTKKNLDGVKAQTKTFMALKGPLIFSPQFQQRSAGLNDDFERKWSTAAGWVREIARQFSTSTFPHVATLAHPNYRRHRQFEFIAAVPVSIKILWFCKCLPLKIKYELEFVVAAIVLLRTLLFPQTAAVPVSIKIL